MNCDSKCKINRSSDLSEYKNFFIRVSNWVPLQPNKRAATAPRIKHILSLFLVAFCFLRQKRSRQWLNNTFRSLITALPNCCWLLPTLPEGEWATGGRSGGLSHFFWGRTVIASLVYVQSTPGLTPAWILHQEGEGRASKPNKVGFLEWRKRTRRRRELDPGRGGSPCCWIRRRIGFHFPPPSSSSSSPPILVWSSRKGGGNEHLKWPSFASLFSKQDREEE